MRVIVTALIELIGCCGIIVYAASQLEQDSKDAGQNHTQLNVLFNQFIKVFKKSYTHSPEEYIKRQGIFKNSLKRHHYLNGKRKSNISAIYGINQFSDLTPEEFKDTFLRQTPAIAVTNVSEVTFTRTKKTGKLPPAFLKKGREVEKRWDWRDEHAVTAVKNQRQCGACWAFSSVESIEGRHAIDTRDLRELSVQQVIDCALGGNFGCQGGDTCRALQWMKSSKVKIVSEKDYPLTDSPAPCQHKNLSDTVELVDYTCSKLVGVSEAGDMARAVRLRGPVSVTVDAATWQDYLGGVIQYHCNNYNNHAVTVVGYNLTGDVPYYIVKNSWGTSFGIDGYLHIEAGKNVCGIAEEVSSVQVKSPS